MENSISRRSLPNEKTGPSSCWTFILSPYCHSWLILISGLLKEDLDVFKALVI